MMIEDSWAVGVVVLGCFVAACILIYLLVRRSAKAVIERNSSNQPTEAMGDLLEDLDRVYEETKARMEDSLAGVETRLISVLDEADADLKAMRVLAGHNPETLVKISGLEAKMQRMRDRLGE